MDKQIRTIMSLIKQNGGTMKFGLLFEKTQDQFDALAGLLNTAKKRGVVDYPGDMLMQGQDDDVDIKVLKETLEDSQVFQSEQIDFKLVQKAIGPEVCFICEKKVFPTERIAPNNRVMHKTCFKCKTCNSNLRLDAYCLNNNAFYCRSDYDKMFMKGGYNF